MPFSENNQGEPMVTVSFTEAELNLFIAFIDDEEVDEDELLGIRRKLVNRRKRFRKAMRVRAAKAQGRRAS